MYKVVEYVEGENHSPFGIWLRKLDKKNQARIQARIFRFSKGNFGDVKNVGDDVLEARLFFGSGYRVYFSIQLTKVIVLLAGGDKSSQNKDIMLARKYLKAFKEANSVKKK